jgi:hypothetical protein
MFKENGLMGLLSDWNFPDTEDAMPNKSSKLKPKLTDAERHKRFVEMAKEVGASEEPKDFEKAFKSVTAPPNRKAGV